MKFAKLDSTLFDNPKFSRLKPITRDLYFRLLCHAYKIENGGVFDLTICDIAYLSSRQMDEDGVSNDLQALTSIGMLNIDSTGVYSIPGIQQEHDKVNERREQVATAQAAYREKRRKSKGEKVNDYESITNQCVNDYESISNHTRLDETRRDETRLDETRRDETIDAGKNSESKKPPPAAESEFVNLWREWTLHTGSLSPAFKERIDEAVNDIDVWRDTLSFGAANRKIPHGNNGLDWALSNYKSGITQKRAQALLANKTNGSTGGRYADKIVPVEVNGTKVYYG